MTPAPSAQFTKEAGGDGSFQRQTSHFRRQVTANGSSGFKAEPGRYHLYVCFCCPWAHRAIIVRALKGLEAVVSMSAVDPIRDERGWRFTAAGEGHGPDELNGFSFLSEAYLASDPAFEGRVTVPTLWDRETGQVLSNESSDVIRMLNTEWNEWATAPTLDLYPNSLRPAIDLINERVYDTVNNGVYKCGFATTQDAYEAAFDPLFATLDHLDALLGGQRYLAGKEPTEADWRLFTTLIRFDVVYFGHFKTNLRRIADYEHLSGYLRELYQWPKVADTVNIDDIKRHYYGTHERINPALIVPKGPELDLLTPHGRDHL